MELVVSKFRKLYWKLFGRPEYPPAIKVHRATSRADVMMWLYENGCKIEDIASFYTVPRERVRQCLWKVYCARFK